MTVSLNIKTYRPHILIIKEAYLECFLLHTPVYQDTFFFLTIVFLFFVIIVRISITSISKFKKRLCGSTKLNNQLIL